MSLPSTPFLLAFAGITFSLLAFAALLYEVFFRYRALLRKRLSELDAKLNNDQPSSLVNIKKLLASSNKDDHDWKTWSRDFLRQSGVRLNFRALIGLSLTIGIVGAIGIGLATHHWLPICLAFVSGLWSPFVYVWLQRRTRFRRLTLQLPDALDFICRAVRAGQTVPAAFQMVADNFAAPIAEEFRYCYEQQNLGISYGAALRGLARSTGIMELRILVIALTVQARLGGSLSDLLENLASIVRKRIALQQRVRTLTGEGRMQAAVLIILPLLVFAAMYVLNRNYAQVLLNRPWLLAGCTISQGIGAALIYKIIQIEY